MKEKMSPDTELLEEWETVLNKDGFWIIDSIKLNV